MHHALTQLAAVLADPGAAGAQKLLDDVRKRWKALAPEERTALTPLAKLAADRIAAAEAEARPSLFDLEPAADPVPETLPEADLAPAHEPGGAAESGPAVGRASAPTPAAESTADAAPTPAAESAPDADAPSASGRQTAPRTVGAAAGPRDETATPGSAPTPDATARTTTPPRTATPATPRQTATPATPPQTATPATPRQAATSATPPQTATPASPPADEDAAYLAYLDSFGADGGTASTAADGSTDDDPFAGVSFAGEDVDYGEAGAYVPDPAEYADAFDDGGSGSSGSYGGGSYGGGSYDAGPPLGGGTPAAPTGPAPERRPLDHVSPESLLHLLGLETFRPGQREAVQAALEGRDSLVVMPTGGGKSLCYQLPALAGDDLTVVVSPLIALMRDQCARLTDLGHPAVMLASGGDGASNRRALDEIRDGTAKVCFAAPERFASGVFRQALRTRAIALFVVDEAHCVSEWGHDFRPDYLRLSAVIGELGHPPVMACTATATPKVADEIVARLALRTATRVRSGFDRPNLSFDVLPFEGQGSVARKRATLVAGVSDPENRPAVVYCGTRKSTEEVADLLAASGVTTVGYHAGMSADARAERQDAFMRGTVDVVVATNAFGMGVDKADVRSVWHWALPGSLEAYYQEAGRAGRDGALGRAVLLASRSDLGRLVRFIQEAEVTVEQVGGLVGRLRARAGADGVVDADPGQDSDRIALAIAERAGGVELEPGPGGRLRVTVLPGGLDHGRVAQMCREAKDRRWQAYRSIEKYASGDNHVCRRRQLLDHFGDPEDGAPLGRCCDVHDPVDWLPPIQVKAGRSRGSSAPAEEEGRPVSDDELAPLKAWRRERADGKPAYTVATDATLREVVRRQPSTPDELLAIKGIGQSFLTKHGDALLDLLRG